MSWVDDDRRRLQEREEREKQERAARKEFIEEVRDRATDRFQSLFWNGNEVRHGKLICPFHNDEHPSGQIFKGKYKCWVCKESVGSLGPIDFAMKKYSLDFMEAVHKLAGMTGVPIPKKNGKNGASNKAHLNGHAASAPHTETEKPEAEESKAPPPWERPVRKRHQYTDENGKPTFKMARFKDGLKPKTMPCQWIDGRWKWYATVDGEKDGEPLPRCLYRITEVRKPENKFIYLAEGEKDADALVDLGLCATCNPWGAGSWRDEYDPYLKGKRVRLLPHNDPPGKKHARKVAAQLTKAGIECKIIHLGPNEKKGFDAYDWIEAGGTKKQLLALVKQAPVYEPEENAAEEVEEDLWVDPKPLRALPRVMALDPKLIPEAFRGRAVDIAERMRVPLEYSAVSLIGCVSGAVCRRALILPRANDATWVVLPNLWGMLIGPSGTKKSPALREGLKPLRVIQARWLKEYKKAMAVYKQDKLEYEAALSEWKKAKDGSDPPEPPEEPIRRRLLTNDASYQKVQLDAVGNPAGLLIGRDELSGFLSTIDRDDHGEERYFYITGWDGNDSYDLERIGRGDLDLPYLCLAIMGTITPQGLRAYLGNLARDAGKSGEGIIQRFQLPVWPDTPLLPKVDRAADEDLLHQVTKIIERLVKMDHDDPVQFRFSAEAQKVFDAWEEELEKEKLSKKLHPDFVSHISKYAKLIPALALLFELVDRVVAILNDVKIADDDEDHGITPKDMWRPYRYVSLDHLNQAIGWGKFLRSNAERIYSCMATTEVQSARALAVKILERALPSPFCYADVYLKGWSLLDQRGAKQGADALTDLNWLRKTEGGPSASGGRRWTKFEINPAVYEAGMKLEE